MSLSHAELEVFLLKKPGSHLSFPFGEDVAVYKVGTGDGAKMFALIKNNSDPAVISLKCTAELAQSLREQYETVMPGNHLHKKLWNTIICSGQVPEEYLYTLIDLSYRLVVENLSKDQRTAVDSL